MTMDFATIALNQQACVRLRNRFSACMACVQACPVGALQADRPVSLNARVCTGCGLCRHLCPVGAFTGDDGVSALWTCASRLKNARTVELTCGFHPDPENGPPEADAVIGTDGCLAALGPSAYLGLLALGTSRVIVRLDACPACAMKAQEGIKRAIAAARHLVPIGDAPWVTTVTEHGGNEWTRRPVYSSQAPPLSRRDLFRLLAMDGPAAAVRTLTMETPSGEKAPPRERQRLLNCLRQPLLSSRLALETVLIDSIPSARLAVDESCTACGVCATVCPTGALRLTVTGTTYRLTVLTAQCTDCGICLDVCVPQALRREGPPTLADFLAEEPILLREGVLHRCRKCGTRFAGETSSGLCPLCDFRQQHPFGSYMPPKMRSPGA
jgi:ferredoxin